ncbi:MAG TPA: WD40 repeat domain-containing protein [Anaerolineales bacterium]|nr:WD40 repeat domain-containing protein [Anaerolineales bacterium]
MTRLGKGWVNDLTFSPNGKILSVATSIGVYLYQVETMELISFLPSLAFVKDTVFIDDKTLVTGANNGTTTVWDIEGTPKVLETLQRTSPVVALGISPDKTILVIELDGRGPSGIVNVINWDRVNPESVNMVSSEYVFNGEYSSAKNILALDTWMENIILVDTQKMKTTTTICRGQCGAFALSQNGDIIATAQGWGDKAQIILWDTTTQKALTKIKNPEPSTSDLTFSTDGKLLASASPTGLHLWNVETAELVNTFDGASTVAFSPDGHLLASVSSEGNLILRETSSGTTMFTIKGFTSMGKAIFQGNSIASIQGFEGISVLDIAGGGMGFYSLDSGSIIFRDISTGEITHTYNIIEENSRVESITFSPDGKLMASVWEIDYKDKIIVLFDALTGERIQTLAGFDPIAFSPDSSLLATGTKGNLLAIWGIASGEKLPLSLGLVPVRFRDPYKRSLVFSPDGSALAILSDTVILRNLLTGKRIKTLESGLESHLGFLGFSGGETGAIGEFSPNGTTLASTWLLPTNNPDKPFEVKGIIILWDVTSGEKIAVLEGHTKPITALTFSPDGTLIASGAEDNTIIIWDAKNGSQLKNLQGHSGTIYSLAFSPDGKLLYSSSLDGTVITWHLDQLLP